jgi:hypothetical protein
MLAVSKKISKSYFFIFNLFFIFSFQEINFNLFQIKSIFNKSVFFQKFNCIACCKAKDDHKASQSGDL